MANDDDDIPVLNEADNEYDRILQENGYDSSEFSFAEKKSLVDDIEGNTSASPSSDMPDPTNDQPRSAIPPEERN